MGEHNDVFSRRPLGVALGGIQTVRTADLVPYADAPEAYATLSSRAQDACETGRCGFGWRHRKGIPLDIKALMVQTRARTVEFDPIVGETEIRGAFGASFVLTHRPAPTAYQTWQREQVDALRSNPDYGTPPQRRDLGAGWAWTAHR